MLITRMLAFASMDKHLAGGGLQGAVERKDAAVPLPGRVGHEGFIGVKGLRSRNF